MAAAAGGGGAPPSQGPSRVDWALLLDQASDFNDELYRENSELRRDIELLRQKARQQATGGAPPGGGGGGRGDGASRAARVANLLPRVMSHVHRALESIACPPGAGGEGLPEAIEDAVRRVLVAAAEFDRGDAALASSEETAKLVSEKVALKEFSMRQQERIQELELAREKLSGSNQGHWTTRITSAFQGTLADAASGASTSLQQQPQQPLPEKAPPPMVIVGDECEVVGRKGAILRLTEDLDSEKVATLLPGSRVRIVELGSSGSRRAKVQSLEPLQPEPEEAVSMASGAPPELQLEDGAVAKVCIEGSAGDGAQVEDSTTEGGETSDGAMASTATPQPASPRMAPEEASNEARIEAAAPTPATGWLSITTKDGKPLIRPIVPHEVTNDEGFPVKLGSTEGYTHLYYCGRHLGVETIPGSDGQCGPADGPQCPSCKRFQGAHQDSQQDGGEERPGDEGVAAAVPSRSGSKSEAAAPPSVRQTPERSGPGGQGAEVTEPPAAAEPAAPAASPTTVTVSTDAWLALRNERNQRERQIKALQAQVKSAQQELDQMAEIRAKLREHRALALEARHRGNEFREMSLMALEELLTRRVLDEEEKRREAEEEEERRRRRKEEEEEREALASGPEIQTLGKPEQEEESATPPALAAGATGASPGGEKDAWQRSLEWQRLLHERETTAEELGRTLHRVEELEAAVEEQRVEMQAAERRRERERRSLLTALRELRAKRGDDPHEDGGEEGSESEPLDQELSLLSEAEQSLEGPSGQALRSSKERQYLQKISELEETAARLRKQVAVVQSREAALNDSAVKRAAALRYATTAVAASGDISTDVSLVAVTSAPSRRPDLEGLTHMLDRLFVENFALSGGRRLAGGRTQGPPASEPANVPSAGSRQQLPPAAASLDLSRFVVASSGNDRDSDDEVSPRVPASAAASSARGSGSRAQSSRDLPRPAPPAAAPAAAPLRRAEEPPPMAAPPEEEPLGRKPPGGPAAGPLAPREGPPVSPRSRLLNGLDFNALPVCE